MEQIVSILLVITGGYLLLGILFALLFVLRGAQVIDPSAEGGTRGFRLMIIPGAMVFWPILMRRWVKKAGPPEERSAHREGAK